MTDKGMETMRDRYNLRERESNQKDRTNNINLITDRETERERERQTDRQTDRDRE